MPIITDSGVESVSLTEYKDLLEIAFKGAFGDDLDLDPQTPQGEIIGILALDFSQLDDAQVVALQQLNIYNAGGNQLDGYGSTYNIPRELSDYSTVVAQVTGASGTIIPTGSQARTIAGDLFQLLDPITISGGFGEGKFQAVELGAVSIESNTLTTIISVVIGWDTIDNTADGTVGDTKEIDIDYRNNIFNRLYINSNGSVNSVRSALFSVNGVEDTRVFENVTNAIDTIQGIDLNPHSIACIIESTDATEDDIANAIYDNKSMGCDTEAVDNVPQTAVTITTIDGQPQIIYYFPVEFVLIDIVVSIEEYDTQPTTTTDITNAILSYFAGTFSPSIPPIRIADTLYSSRLYQPILSVTGFDITALTININGNSVTNPEKITPELNQKLVTATANITVNIST